MRRRSVSLWLALPMAFACCVRGGPASPRPPGARRGAPRGEAPREAPGPLSWLPRPPSARPDSAARPLLLRGATVWTGAGRILERTDVLVVGGRIRAVGSGLAAPAGARVEDVTGDSSTQRSSGGNVELKPGMTEAEVVRLLGAPKEKVAFGSKSLWRYEGFSLTFQNGRVLEMK